MPTIRQRKLAQAVLENVQATEPLNKQELVASVGYAEITADRKAGEILEQKGVKEALAELGFNEESAKSVVKEIMLDKEVEPNARLKATDQVFKVHGSYAPEKSLNLNLSGEIRHLDPKAVELKEEYEKKLLETIQNKPDDLI